MAKVGSAAVTACHFPEYLTTPELRRNHDMIIDRNFFGAMSNRVLELDGGRARLFGGGYKEYVAET